MEESMRSSMKTSERLNSLSVDNTISVYLKIFLNYFQMISSLSQSDVALPSFLQDYFNFGVFFGSMPTQIMSLDCLFEC